VEHIPIRWALPRETMRSTRLVLWLAGGVEPMDGELQLLERLASLGFAAISFDSPGRGARAPEPFEVIWPRVIANFPNVVWPIIGLGALEALRVLDWAARTFEIAPPFGVGGWSLGGDIAIAAAGLDRRVGCVATIIATPDWRRPGMHADGALVAAGEPDAFARYFYDRINPLTHLDAYGHRPAMTFECGDADDHVPADGALRFRAALAQSYRDSESLLRVTLHPGIGHAYTQAMEDNCIEWFKSHLT